MSRRVVSKSGRRRDTTREPARRGVRVLGVLALVVLLGSVDLAAPRVARAASVATGPTPVDTVVHPGGATSYVLCAGNSTITVIDTKTSAVLNVVPLGSPPSTCTDMDWSVPLGRLLVACTTGQILSVDPTAGQVIVFVNNPAASYTRLCADNFVPGVTAWAYDATSGWLQRFLGNVPMATIPLGMASVTEIVEKRRVAGAPAALDSNLYVLGAAAGMTRVLAYDRATTLTTGPVVVPAPGAVPTGIDTTTGATGFVGVNVGGLGRLYALTLAPLAVVGAPVAVGGTAGADVAVAGQFVLWLVQTPGAAGSQLLVYDAGDPNAILFAGTMAGSAPVAAAGALSVHMAPDATLDDVYAVYADATPTATTHVFGDEKASFVDAPPPTVVGGTEAQIQPTDPGICPQESLVCAPCQEIMADSTNGGTDASGYAQPTSCSAANVHYATGEEVYKLPLFGVPGVGPGADFMLTYRSRRAYDYRYGNGWFFNQDVRMVQAQNYDLRVHNGLGRIDTWTFQNGTYQRPPLHDTTLLQTQNQTDVTDRFGSKTTYDAQGYRTLFADRFQNQLQYLWLNDRMTSMTDTLGRSYSMSYDTTGRLSSLTDFGGRTWSFYYDYVGQLRRVSTPPSADFPQGRTRWFSYSGNNADPKLRSNLVHVWSWKGERVQTLSYGSNDLVTAEKLGAGSYSVSYDPANSLRTVLDRAGNTTKFTFDANAMVTRIERFTKGVRPNEPTSYVTEYTIGANGLPGHVVHPKGNRDDYLYDALYNITEIRRRETNTTVNQYTDVVRTYTYGPFGAMTSATDPMGNTTTWTRDALGNATAVDRPTVTSPATQNSSVVAVYDSRGRLLSIGDGEGRLTAFEYYTSGTQNGYLKKTTVDPQGLALQTTLEYDPYGAISAVVDPRGNRSTVTIDGEGYVTGTTSPTPYSIQTRISYDANRNVTKVEVQNADRNGVVDATTPWIDVTATHDPLGRPLTTTRRLTPTTSATTAFVYDGAGQLTSVVAPDGQETRFEYDERQLLFKRTVGYGTAVAATTQYDYGLNGALAKVTDPRGNSIQYRQDAFDRTDRVTNELGHTVDFTFDKRGLVVTAEARSATGTQMALVNHYHDEVGRLWKTVQSRFGTGISSSTPTTVVTRDRSDRVTAVKDPLLRTTLRSYDAAGRLSTVTDPAGDTVTYSYDPAGNVVRIETSELPAGGGAAEVFRTDFSYDNLNRMTAKHEVDRLNSSNILLTAYHYDSRSNLTFLVDAEGHPTRFTYDLAGRLLKRERALSTGSSIDDFLTKIEEGFAYDASGRLTSLRDDNYRVTSYEVDPRDRVTRTTWADNGSVAYVYDAAGNLTSWTDQAGTTVTQTYDERNRLTVRSVARGSGVQGTTAETFTYDALDRVVTAVDDDYRVESVHDSVGNLTQQRQGYNVSGQEKWKTLTFATDDGGSRVSTVYPSQFSLGHQRDVLDRLTALVDVAANANVATFLWQGVGRLQKTSNQNGTATEYAYDGFARVATVDHLLAGGTGSLHRLDYLYDKVHNRRMEKNAYDAAWVSTLPAAAQAMLGARNGKGDVYRYDWASRLADARYDVVNPVTEVANPGSQPYARLVTYALDGLGNRSQVQTTVPPGTPVTVTYATDVVNQYTAVGGVNRAHDANGNVKDDGTLLFAFDYRNRITEVRLKATNALVATYRHDALGRRVEKAVSGGATTRFVYDGQDVVEEYDGADVWQASYTFEDSIDSPRTMDRADLADVDGDANTTEVLRFVYHQNALGSVTEVSAPGGAVVEWVTYDVYGKATIYDKQGAVVAQSAVGNRFLFTGRELDPETGLYHYRARAYDPATGRFVQRDPAGYVDGMSLYEYTASAPTSWLDSTGLKRGKVAEWEAKVSAARSALVAAQQRLDKALAAKEAARIKALNAASAAKDVLDRIAALLNRLQSGNPNCPVSKADLDALEALRKEHERLSAAERAAVSAYEAACRLAADAFDDVASRAGDLIFALVGLNVQIAIDIADDTGKLSKLRDQLDNWELCLAHDALAEFGRKLGFDDLFGYDPPAMLPADASDALSDEGADLLVQLNLQALFAGVGKLASKFGLLRVGSPIDPNKIAHVFHKAEHRLAPLVAKFGSEERAYRALLRATEKAVKAGKLGGQFKVDVTVRGLSVTVRGRVVDGVVRIGTAYR